MWKLVCLPSKFLERNFNTLEVKKEAKTDPTILENGFCALCTYLALGHQLWTFGKKPEMPLGFQIWVGNQ